MPFFRWQHKMQKVLKTFARIKLGAILTLRIVNNEILHIITYMGEKSVQFGYKAFHLLSGVATVYKKEFNFSVTPKHNSDWLVDLGMINETKDSDYPTVTFPRNSMIFYYNEENLQQIIKESFSGAEIIIGLIL